jgi:adenylate cyclase
MAADFNSAIQQQGTEVKARPEPRPSRWRAILHNGMPILGVMLVIALVAAIAAYIHDSNRRGAVSLSNDLLDAIDRRIDVQLNAYFSPAEQFLDWSHEIAGERGVFDGGTATEAFALKTLPKIPAVAGYSYGDPDGNFQYIVVNDQGGYDTKLIDRRDGKHRVTWTRRDAEGKVTATEEDPADTYDPRIRPWYLGATKAGQAYWTDTYSFFTLRKPGITLSLPHYDSQHRLTAVSGLDIEVATLCAFLKGLEIGITGKAIVVDGSGRVVAYPSDDWLPADTPDAVAPQLDQLNDPVLTRVYNRLRVEGYGRKVLDVGDRRIIILSEPLKALTGRDWSVLIVVPEADFVGFVAASGWIALVMSGVVGLIMVALAALLVWRGVLAERRSAAATTRQGVLEQHTQAFADLAGTQDLIDRTSKAGVRAATEKAVATSGAKRAGIWRFTPDGRRLACEDCYDQVASDHTSGMELYRDELPKLFAALAMRQPIDTDHAGSDPRTSELSTIYLEPLGIDGVYIAPIVSGDKLVGILMIEAPRRGDRGAGLGEFCGALSSLLALRFLPDADQPVSSVPAPSPARPAGPPADRLPEPGEGQGDVLAARRATLERTLLSHGCSSLAALGKGRIDQAAVSVLKLPDWMLAAQRLTEDESASRMETVVAAVRDAIEGSGVAYAALLDDQIVLASFPDGPAGGSTTAGSIGAEARRVALTAIALRDRLIEITASWGAGSEFRMSMDIGSVMTSSVGADAAARNLWGGAIAVAKVLAATGGRRLITVSEAAYSVLARDFLFRPRGTYFLPETGTMRTFVLVGEL